MCPNKLKYLTYTNIHLTEESMHLIFSDNLDARRENEAIFGSGTSSGHYN